MAHPKCGACIEIEYIESGKQGNQGVWDTQSGARWLNHLAQGELISQGSHLVPVRPAC